jgi:hypothetical protein
MKPDETIRKWYGKLGKRGGSSTSDRKAQAARENGKKHLPHDRKK